MLLTCSRILRVSWSVSLQYGSLRARRPKRCLLDITEPASENVLDMPPRKGVIQYLITVVCLHSAEILGAVFSVLIIWILTGILIYMAIDRIVHQDYDIDAGTMIIVSSVGVAMNIAMGLILHGGLCSKLNLVHHGHSHGGGGGGHNHSHSANSGHGHSHARSSRNMNVRAALIHVIGDLVQSIGVLVAAIIIKFWVLTIKHKERDVIAT